MKKESKIPNLYNNKADCCGCTACESICPARAIEMKFDQQGFSYPIIYEERCLKCNLCITVCPLK